MSESAASAKPVALCLARNRRSPKRPSEPRPSGVHPEEGAVERRREASNFRGVPPELRVLFYLETCVVRVDSEDVT